MIPENVVEAVMDAVGKAGHDYLTRATIKTALEAVTPHLMAQALEEAADRFDTRSETLLRTMQNMAGHPDTSADDVVRYGAYSAESNTTAHWLRARTVTLRATNERRVNGDFV